MQKDAQDDSNEYCTNTEFQNMQNQHNKKSQEAFAATRMMQYFFLISILFLSKKFMLC